jgi:hypothetical protein
MLITGLTLFSLASLTVGLAPDPVLTRASDGTWSSTATIAPLTAAAVLLFLFAAVERTRQVSRHRCR